MDSELTVTLSVRDGAAACDFYRAAFGAAELNRLTSPDGDVVGEFAVGRARFFVADEAPEYGNVSPPTPTECSVRVGLFVEDPDALVERAVAAGATVVAPVEDQDYGYRLGRIVDPFGHHWEIARPLHG